MRFSEIKNSMNQVSPPIQPKIRPNVKNYSEIVLEWNPVSIKKHALFYQFVSGPNSDSITLIPDGCINVFCNNKIQIKEENNCNIPISNNVINWSSLKNSEVYSLAH